MIIPEFWCGVLATVFMQMAMLITYSCYVTLKKRGK